MVVPPSSELFIDAGDKYHGKSGNDVSYMDENKWKKSND